MLLYIVLAYLMLFAALTNAVCLHSAPFLPLISANAFYFHALSLFIDTYFVYFIFLFASCTVLLICLFFLILCSHGCCLYIYIYIFYERPMSSPEK